MSKTTVLVTNFQNSIYTPPAPFNLQYRDLKLCDLAKLWIFKLITEKSNFKKSVMTSF